MGPSPPPSLFSDRVYDGSEEEDLDVETVFSLESGEFPSEQPPSANPSRRELAHLFGEIIGRGTKALNIVLPERRFQLWTKTWRHSLAPQKQPVDASLAREFQSAKMCLASVSKEQAVASGISARWLSSECLLAKVLSDFQLSLTIEPQFLPVSAADQLALCPVRALSECISALSR
ncbi:unnamed protein product [Arctogadus glacialis]